MISPTGPSSHQSRSQELRILGSYMKDADEDYLAAAEAGKLRRYLYIVRVPG